MADRCKGAVIIIGLVTCIVACHYVRLFNSWAKGRSHVDRLKEAASGRSVAAPPLAGTPFYDAYRCREWLLTMSLRVPVILLVMKLQAEAATTMRWWSPHLRADGPWVSTFTFGGVNFQVYILLLHLILCVGRGDLAVHFIFRLDVNVGADDCLWLLP